MTSFSGGFRSIRSNPLAPIKGHSKDAAISDTSIAPMPKSYKRPAQDTPPFPPMEPIVSPTSPFLARVYELTRHWVEEEWLILDAIKRDASCNGKNTTHHTAIKESRLTLDNLANRLDNISKATLFRELQKLNAPPPGEIIRITRLHFARHLLIHTRMLIRDVAQRAGYDDDRHFAQMFTREFGCRPSDFRRTHVSKTALKPKRKPPQKS